MDETTAVINNADSHTADQEIVSSDVQVIAKPQIVSTEIKSVLDVTTHVVIAQDTLESLAAQYSVTEKSIKWSNSLTASSLTVGSELAIPPIDGIVYTVKEGDTVKSLADKYKGDEAKIVAFNDTELTGLVVGSSIVIPDGEIVPPAPVYSAATASNGFKAVYGPANGYDFGWCTWHAANRRAQSGNPLPRNLGNAVTWSARARAAGLIVSDIPVAGAVIWHDQGQIGRIAGGLGHVAYVEQVNPDGSIIVSDMNSRGVANIDLSGGPTGGWSRVSYRQIAPSEFYRYDFIY